MSDSGPPKLPDLPPKTIQNYVFGVILVLLFILVCRLFAPFFSVLLWSVLLYILFNPLHKRLVKKIDVKKTGGKILKSLWAAVFALGTVVLILLPVFFVVFHFFRQIIELITLVREELNPDNGLIRELVNRISLFVKDISADQIHISPAEIQSQVLLLLSSGMRNLIQLSSAVAKNIGSFFINLLFMIFCLFFFYSDGAYLSSLALDIIPIRREYISALKNKFLEITRNLFLGYIVVALIQALMAYIIFLIFGVKGALVFAALTFICVFIPMVGGGLVWIPLGSLRILNGDVGGGILFFVVSGIFISTLDNVLRPFFLQNRIQLHPLIIFIAILGGIVSFGFNGVILGPVVVIIFLTVLDLFRTEHHIEHGNERQEGR
jgi:predicted PurR-regulated permease PerM